MPDRILYATRLFQVGLVQQMPTPAMHALALSYCMRALTLPSPTKIQELLVV